ncbi:MAG: Synerg-CTERM sorting domain-containing protein [Synergistes sp.]|nr:Synerg-CTERM sorting domain-containing protein [Synergistes sp.]
MKRFSIIAIVAMLLTACAVSGATAADKDNWKIGGKWNYKSELPYQQIKIPGISDDIFVELKETGVIDVQTEEVPEGEKTVEYMTCLKLSSVKATLKYVIGGNTTTYTKEIQAVDVPIERMLYDPNKPISFDYSLDIPVKGMPPLVLTEKASFAQTREGKCEGSAAIYLNDTKLGEDAILTATRPSESSSGCSVGFGALALLCTAPILFRKRH